MTDEPSGDPAPDLGPAGRPAPDCPKCSGEMRFEGGVSTHDLWAERFVCTRCGAEAFRSYGRGSV